MPPHSLTFRGELDSDVQHALRHFAERVEAGSNAGTITAGFPSANHSLGLFQTPEGQRLTLLSTRRPLTADGWEDWTKDVGANQYEASQQLLPSPDSAVGGTCWRLEDAWVRDGTEEVSERGMQALGLTGGIGWVWKAVRVAWRAAEVANTVVGAVQLAQIAWEVVQRANLHLAVEVSKYELEQRARLEAATERERHLADDPNGRWHWYYHHIDEANRLL